MKVFLIIALIASVLRGQAYKVSLKVMGIYLQSKDYTLPTDSELKECSRIALEQIFKVKVK